MRLYFCYQSFLENLRKINSQSYGLFIQPFRNGQSLFDSFRVVLFLIGFHIELNDNKMAVRILQSNLAGNGRLRKFFMVMDPVSKREPKSFYGHLIGEGLAQFLAFRLASVFLGD